MASDEGSSMPRCARSRVIAFVVGGALLAAGMVVPVSATAADDDIAAQQSASPQPDADMVLGLLVLKRSAAVTNRSLEGTTSRAGAEVAQTRSLTPTVGVVNFDTPLTFAEAAPIAAALDARPDIIAVGPNRRVYPAATPTIPNDLLFGQQWNMWSGGTSSDYGTRAAGLWPRTTGTDSVVVGIIDTGSTTHPDLVGTTVPGFDFITNVDDARDGNSWDPDPTDEGDWCTQEGTRSDWHGTHVHGVINAVHNNGIGISGVAPSVKVQHLRVIGACGGTSEDILAAVIWGSGGRVSDVISTPGQDPGINPTPASVLNLSLGGAGDCDPVSQSVFDQARSRGTTIVAAAGNEGTSVTTSWPANCHRVIAVASGTSAGTLSTFSNYGTAPGQITLTAPGASILSTINRGTTVATLPGYGNLSGTSMATPHVAAAAAILYSLGVTTPDGISNALRAAVRRFPAGTSCDAIRCGAGLLDASRLGKPGPITGFTRSSYVWNGSSYRVTVRWKPPQHDGGPSVTGYVARLAVNGTRSRWAAVDKAAIVLRALRPARRYTLEVRAVNSGGRGAVARYAFTTPLR
jgi:serine protease